MRAWLRTSSGQFLLLGAVMICFFLIWMTPVLLTGFPFTLTSSVKDAHHFAQTGVLQNILNPFFTLFLRAWLPVIDWQNATGWAALSAATLAAAVLPLWWSIRRVFDARLAWAAVVIFCFLPMHWKEAVGTGYYPLAFLCLFTGFALFLFFTPRRRIAAIACLGLCFGLTFGAAHAFVTFLPWFVCVYLWEYRSQWKKALLELAIGGACAYVGFALPLLPNALQPGLSATERLGVFLPLEENLTPPVELYGDEYAYLFLKDEFDARMISQARSGSFFEQRDNENFRINYGVGSYNPLHVLLNGAWLFFNAAASLFMQETVGGIFLWLFIVPGLMALFRTHRRTILQLLGLWLSMELILRFGFHYARIHLMNIGWIVAIIAAGGVLFVADAIQRSSRWLQVHTIAAIILLLISLQLLQANRKLFAHEYSRSGLPRALAVAEALQNLPATAVIARPPDDTLMAFSDRPSIVLHPDTLDVLAEKGKVADPITHYGITHIVGYDPADTALIRTAVPTVREIPLADNPPVSLTPFKRWLLNVMR